MLAPYTLGFIIGLVIGLLGGMAIKTHARLRQVDKLLEDVRRLRDQANEYNQRSLEHLRELMTKSMHSS